MLYQQGIIIDIFKKYLRNIPGIHIQLHIMSLQDLKLKKKTKKINASWPFTTFFSGRKTKYQKLKISKQSYCKYKTELSFT